MASNPFRFLKHGDAHPSFREWFFTDVRAPTVIIEVTDYPKTGHVSTHRHIYRKELHIIEPAKRAGWYPILRSEDIRGDERDTLIAMAALRT